MGLKSINGKSYIDLSNYVDLSKFDEMQPNIFRGFALAKEFAQVGNLDILPEWLNLDSTEKSYKPLIIAYEEYKQLPNDDPLIVNSSGLTIDQLATYLKFAFGGYDLYITYHIHLIEKYFSEFNQWMKNLDIFESIDNAFIMTMESGGIAFDHQHPPMYNDDTDKPSEFIYIRPNLDRPFYVRDNETLEKFYIDSRVAYWNDQDRHGGDAVLKPTYSVRIEGKFTQEFKNIIYGD